MRLAAASLVALLTIPAQAQDLQTLLEERRGVRRAMAKTMPTGATVAASTLDSLILADLYDATQGAGWHQSTGWLSDPVQSWYGVALDPAGRVVGLDLQSNGLAGTLPDSLGALDSLRTLYLADNFIAGSLPPALGMAGSLQVLSLWGNALTGIVPPELSQLKRLRDLLLFDNDLSGGIPDSLGTLPVLDRLWLDFNVLDGPVPAALGNLTQLTELFLDANNLTGPLPAALSGLVRVISLYAGHNGLDGPIPAELGSLPALQNLSLAGNQHTGSIPVAVALTPNLVKLLLSGNQLIGSIPPQLATRPKLTTVELARNNLTGPIPDEVGAIRELRILDLSHNHLSGPLPGTLGWATALKILHLAGNDLTGMLPEALSNLGRMESLDLSSNQLEGEITPVYSMTRLRSVQLQGNGFAGGLGSGFGFMPQLRELNVAGNKFSGTLEALFDRPTPIQVLRLEHNRLEGAVPVSVTQSRQLTLLDLAGNRLSGLPPLGALSQLDTLDVSYNRLTFHDLEPNVTVAPGGFRYAPQDTVATGLLHEGTDIVFFVSTGGTESVYQWYQDDVAIAGAVSDTLRVSSTGPEASYHCTITNTLLPDLTLTSRKRHSTDNPAALLEGVPQRTFALRPGYPNPFRERTALELVLPVPAHVLALVYDLAGRRVAMLMDQQLHAGSHLLTIEGAGNAPGPYVVRATADGMQAVQMVVRVR